MKIIFKAIVISSILFGAVHADPIADRQTAMKSISQTMKGLNSMAKGEIDFDSESAKTGLLQIEATASSLPGLFPAGTDQGDTEAAPAIWTDAAKFNSIMSQFVSDTKMSSEPADSFALSDQLDKISQNCKACHADFRIKK